MSSICVSFPLYSILFLNCTFTLIAFGFYRIVIFILISSLLFNMISSYFCFYVYLYFHFYFYYFRFMYILIFYILLMSSFNLSLLFHLYFI